MQDLERNGAIVLLVLRQVYGSHASTAQLALDVVIVGKCFFEAVQHAVGSLSAGNANLRDGLVAREVWVPVVAWALTP